MFLRVILPLQIFFVSAFSNIHPTQYANIIFIQKQTDGQLNELVGKRITIVGKAVNMKLGAALLLKSERIIWMNEMRYWPDGFYINDKKSKTVKVTGILIERYDLPVGIYNEDSLPRQEILLPKGTDLKKASHRFLLKEHKWVEVK